MTTPVLKTRLRVAERLRQVTPHILQTWQAETRQRLLQNAALDSSLLLDSLPKLLDNLVAALEDSDWSYEVDENIEIAVEHGQQRYGIAEFTFGKVIDEYALLRRAITRALGDTTPDSQAAFETIHAFIDAAIKHASTIFANLRCKEQAQQLTQQRDEAIQKHEALADQADSVQTHLQTAQMDRAHAEGERDVILQHARELEHERSLRSRVISMLGHDMRTPLSAASISAQMIAQRPHNIDGNVKRAHRVYAALKRMDSMIENMLNADSLQAGEALPVHVDTANLGDLVRKTCEELTAVHGPRFVLEAPDTVTGFWDFHALQRLLENLCNNAVKYGSAETPVTVSVTHTERHVQLSVHNWGIPVPHDALPSLFKPHFRTDAAVAGEQPGWGLGLALVQAVAVAHGGHVSVHSDAQRGTTFFVDLPRDCRDAPG